MIKTFEECIDFHGFPWISIHRFSIESSPPSATASLSALMQQRSSLKGVQRKVLDMAQTLGLSNNVLRMIERRQFWDKVILYGGMLTTLALIWFVFRYMRPASEAE